jgi:hypothetical protein
MVQKENIAVTAVMNLFHKYRYNMKRKLSKFRRTLTDVRCGRPLWHGRRQHDSLVLATPVPEYPVQLSRPRPLSAVLTAVSPVEVDVQTPCPSPTPKRRNCKALGRVTWGPRTSVAHHSVQHGQSNVVEDGGWGDRVRVHSNVVGHRLAAKWSRVPLLPTGATTTRTACRDSCTL